MHNMGENGAGVKSSGPGGGAEFSPNIRNMGPVRAAVIDKGSLSLTKR